MAVNRVQTELLKQAFAKGASRLKPALEMVIGTDSLKTTSRVGALAPADFIERSGIGSGPLSVVESSVHGDVEGTILLLQRQQDFQVFGQLVECAMLGIGPAGGSEAYTPDWLEGRDIEKKDEDRIDQERKDALTELANMLFGVVLVAFYENFRLATFQDLPRLTVSDRDQSVLKNNLSRSDREGHVTLFTELVAQPGDATFSSWVVFLPLGSGVEKLLKSAMPARSSASDSGGTVDRPGGDGEDDWGSGWVDN